MKILQDLLDRFTDDLSMYQFMKGYQLLLTQYSPPIAVTHRPIGLPLLEKASYYSKYAIAVYGWKLVGAWSKMEINSTVSTFVGGDKNEKVVNDRTFCAYVGLEPNSIMHTRWFSSHFDPAHAVSVDKRTRKIVVSVRGTMDMRDVFADLICVSAEFEGVKCHSGMLKIALSKFELLDECVTNLCRRLPTYNLVFTGHSLGAGVASILGLVWSKRHPDVPVEVFAFSPPAVFPLEVAEKISWITSFVCGMDVVPRLSEGSLFDLRDKILFVDSHSGGLGSFVSRMATAGNALGTSMSQRVVDRYGPAFTVEQIRALVTHPKLFVPGIVYQVRKSGPHVEDWVVELVPNSHYDEILIDGKMYSDHFPDYVERSLNHALTKLTGGRPLAPFPDPGLPPLQSPAQLVPSPSASTPVPSISPTPEVVEDISPVPSVVSPPPVEGGEEPEIVLMGEEEDVDDMEGDETDVVGEIVSIPELESPILAAPTIESEVGTVSDTVEDTMDSGDNVKSG
eukprot:TRINITY_DN1272_c0_g1_i1.p1 TRINITY_DN1272_c0_g1~~TRINITY_DN1272_c0_g1_i1.p1  ORF type:complete len:593 (-),score=80.98 TRINITY_DN1272_c0_g1_i1:97-1623(-)